MGLDEADVRTASPLVAPVGGREAERFDSHGVSAPVKRLSPRKALFQWAARFGYAARGGVYLVTGAFAILAAAGFRSSSTGTSGALAAAAGWPMGRAWLLLVGAGLICFAAWRGIQAVFDPDGMGRDAKGRFLRAGKGISALLHLGLALTAFKLLDTLRNVNEDAEARREAARLLQLPFGEWVLMALAAAVLLAAAGNLLKAVRHDFDKELSCPPGARSWAKWAGRLGYGARGGVLVLVSLFLFAAARSRDASNARDVGGAIQAVEALPFGSVVMGALGGGFLAFGAYGVLQALFRRIRAPKPVS